MTQPPDFEARVTALETRTDNLEDSARLTRQEVAAALELARGADREASEMRAFRQVNNRTLNAMREDLTDLRGQVTDLSGQVTDLSGQVTDLSGQVTDLSGQVTDLSGQVTDLRARVDEGFARVDEGFARVDGGFAEVHVRLDASAAGMQVITGMLTTLIDRSGDEQDGGDSQQEG